MLGMLEYFILNWSYIFNSRWETIQQNYRISLEYYKIKCFYKS